MAKKPGKPSATPPSSIAPPPTLERLELTNIIRNEVNAANREWLSKLTRGMSQLLEDEGGTAHHQLESPIFDLEEPITAATPTIKAKPKTGKRPKPAQVIHQKNTFEPNQNEEYLDLSSSNRAHRYIEAQNKDAKFAQFAFGDAAHAYVAGDGGLWNVKLEPKGGAGADAGDDKKAATPTAPGTQVAFTQLGAEKITLNGLKNQDSPVTKNITDLKLYGAPDPTTGIGGPFPVVRVADEKDAKEPDMGLKIFAALDAEGTKFATNAMAATGELDPTGKFNDATQDLDGHNTYPLIKPINQPIVAMAAARDQNRFFVAVADSVTTDRKLYARPEDWEKTVRQAIIDGMGGVKKHDQPAQYPGNDVNGIETKFVKLLTPDTPVPNALLPAAINPLRNALATGLTNSISNAIYTSGINFNQKDVHQKFADLAFRDAINLRKGGLLDLGHSIYVNKDVGGGAINNTTIESLALIANVDGIKAQAAPGNAAPVFQSPGGADTPQNLFAAALQVSLGWGIKQLTAATKDITIDLDKAKPFASLNSHAIGDPIKDINIYCADQDGLARGICVADIVGTEIATMKDHAAPPPPHDYRFFVNPGKIVTTAMYDGIKLDDKDALTKNFGKLEQVGIPCAVYSGADPYPASRAIINGEVDMVWDDQLQRLFVGFGDICLGDNQGALKNGSGGVCSIMVGKEKTDAHIKDAGVANAMYLQPIIGPHFQSLLFQKHLSPGVAAFDAKLPWAGTRPTANPTDYIVGFYQKHDANKLTTAKTDDDLHASAKKLRVMHTSTGKDYLVFNGGVAPQAEISSLNSKLYAVPLIAPYDANLLAVPEAGLLAAAQRADAAHPDYLYSKGLKGIDFGAKDIAAGKPMGMTIGVINPADPMSDLSKLHAKIQGDDGIEKILDAWGNNMGGGGWAHKGKDESKAIWTLMHTNKPLVSGLATTALAACYAKTDGDAIGDKDHAGTRAFTLLNPTGYEVDPLKKNSVFERIEGNGLDKALDGAVGAADRKKYQAPADEVARYVDEAKIQAAGDDGLGDGDAVYGAIHADHNEKWVYAAGLGGANALSIDNGKFAGGPLNNNGDAGGIAAAVAGIEGSLGWGIKNILTGGGALQKQKLIPAIATMHTDAQYPAFDYVRVGADAKRLSYDTSANILDSWVLGDSVYVALGNTRDQKHTGEAGVFESKAIFHSDGFIRSWTPWRRVQGSSGPAGGVALDPTSSRYWTTTTKDATSIDADKLAEQNVMRVTAWGKGYQQDPASDGRLSTVLGQVFGDSGGVFGMFSFGPDTPGFKERDPASTTPAKRHEQFSMIVATGNGRVALAKSGQFDRKDGIFKPTDAYVEKTNVFVFDGAPNAAGTVHAGTALSKLGIITCAEVSRLPLAAAPSNRMGWLFVGGTGGLAVLTRWFNGKGWNTGDDEGLSDLLPGAQRDDFPTGSGWRFMQILTGPAANPTNPFKDVRKIVSDGSRYLYVMMPDSIYRIDITAQSQNAPGGGRTAREYSIFKRTAPVGAPPAIPDPTIDYTIVLTANQVIHPMATVEGATTAAGAASIFDGATDKQFLDMMVGYNKTDGSATQLIIGTTAGLFYNKYAKDAVPRQTGMFDVGAPADLPVNGLNPAVGKEQKWTQLKAAAAPADPFDQEIKGPVMRLEFTSSQPGNRMKKALASDKADQTYADGNLVVTTLAEDPVSNKKYIATYRFDVSGASTDAAWAAVGDWNDPKELVITPFKEPYHISGDKTKTTPYFYKLGELNESEKDKIEFDGPFDYFPRTAHIANSVDGFAEGVWMLPEPTSFLRDKATGNFEDIDLGLDLTLPLYFGDVQLEPASGAQVVAGEFGVRVND